jgi:hypothetical protein
MLTCNQSPFINECNLIVEIRIAVLVTHLLSRKLQKNHARSTFFWLGYPVSGKLELLFAMNIFFNSSQGFWWFHHFFYYSFNWVCTTAVYQSDTSSVCSSSHLFKLHLPILSSLFEGLHKPVISIGKSVNGSPLVCNLIKMMIALMLALCNFCILDNYSHYSCSGSLKYQISLGKQKLNQHLRFGVSLSLNGLLFSQLSEFDK